ncbi:hypothetical protein DSO57_1009161 [Entomophthora muscae]|uniref:Uncharacterized protein n=1 Tax=Entomophthora muscae TaxID=34485 RepID=A0ACC2T6R0_9FUNG|nr:hypothetical protein DSO57_1009161 [Entomophthora muscae]
MTKRIILHRLMQESGNYKTTEALIRMDPKYASKAFSNVRNIPDTYSYVTNKLLPAATKQTSAAIKQIHTVTVTVENQMKGIVHPTKPKISKEPQPNP